jgi:hypothetical protein
MRREPVAQLGSVFEDDDDAGPRGPDLRVSVEVPRAALGATFHAPVPARIAVDGELVERAVLDGEVPGQVVLHLPEQLPARALLRLRGQGGLAPDAAPGDLLVLVELVERPPRDDERIVRSAAMVRSGDGAPTMDMTWWVLLALALFGGSVLVVLAL